MNILGHDAEVLISGTMEEIGAFGKLHTKTMRIQVAEDLSEDQTQATVLHEVLEALNCILDLELDHPTLSRLEGGLFQVLKSNGIDLSPLIGWKEVKVNNATISVKHHT